MICEAEFNEGGLNVRKQLSEREKRVIKFPSYDIRGSLMSFLKCPRVSLSNIPSSESQVTPGWYPPCFCSIVMIVSLITDETESWRFRFDCLEMECSSSGLMQTPSLTADWTTPSWVEYCDPIISVSCPAGDGSLRLASQPFSFVKLQRFPPNDLVQ